jgi:hypothetical protein
VESKFINVMYVREPGMLVWSQSDSARKLAGAHSDLYVPVGSGSSTR